MAITLPSTVNHSNGRIYGQIVIKMSLTLSAVMVLLEDTGTTCYNYDA